jgi:hypothetical protein
MAWYVVAVPHINCARTEVKLRVQAGTYTDHRYCTGTSFLFPHFRKSLERNDIVVQK